MKNKNKFSGVNFNIIALYLKYGIISFPNLNIKKGKRLILKKINNMKYAPNTYEDVLKCLKTIIDKRIKLSKDQNEKVILFLSSGVDSRLLYYLIYKSCKNHNYLKNFYNLTADVTIYKKKYSENLVLKKNFKHEIHNHIVVKVKYKDLEEEILESSKINKKPINGLPIVSIKKLFEYCSKKFKDKIVITGIGDPIFFNANDNIIKKLKEKKSIQYASDGGVYTTNDFLTEKYNYQADKIFKNLRFKKLFKIKNIYHDFILKQYFYLKGPKVRHEVQNLSNFFKVKIFSPFCTNKLHQQILSLPSRLLFNGKPKSFINEVLKTMEGAEPNQGLKINSPQRELLFEKYKFKIIKIIKSSCLVDLNLVNKNKLLKLFNQLLRNFQKYKNEKKFDNFSSYEIWKFISAELFLRSIKRK